MDTLDTRPSQQQIEADVTTIKNHMPQTYKAIRAKADEMKGVFALVRRGLAGEPNCFYAVEGGRVIGTKFNLVNVTDEVAGLMVRFGSRHLCMWGISSSVAEVSNGSH